MASDSEVLEVRFLGGFSAAFRGTELADSKRSVSQFISLMQLILYYHQSGVSRSLMQETLFSDRDVDDERHAIRNLLYNAKKRLRAAGLPDAEYITSEKGNYYWTKDIPLSCDTERMEHLAALAGEETDTAERLALLTEAVHCYRGEFLSGQNTASWMAREVVRYRDLFRSCANSAAMILRNDLRFKELLELGEYAALVDPYAEWETLSVEALSALYRFKEAEDLCDATVERYIQEHGRREPVYIRDLSNRLSASMVHRYADIRTIQLSLGTQTSGHKGGFACSYPVFQEVYRTLGRMMARYADRYFLMLCTLVDSKGNVMEDGPRLDELSLRLKETIGISIRHSDTFTRYGKGQYLILLTNTSREDCEVVRKRIDRNFLSPGQRTGVEYQINTAIICPDEILLD